MTVSLLFIMNNYVQSVIYVYGGMNVASSKHKYQLMICYDFRDLLRFCECSAWYSALEVVASNAGAATTGIACFVSKS